MPRRNLDDIVGIPFTRGNRLIKNLNPEEKNLHAEGDSTKDLHSALLEFQKEKTAAGLGEKTGQFGKYSDLKTTLQAVQLELFTMLLFIQLAKPQ